MILRVSMSSSIDSRLTCVGTRSRQTSIHVPSPQPVSQERGAGEPVGLHHGPSLRRRRGRRREKKNKNPAMELSPPPPGISEAAAAPPAVRSLQLQFPARMLRLPPPPPPLGCQDAPCPEGSGPARRPGRRSQAGLGRCPTGSPHWQPLRNAKKDPSSPLGERAAATKWCLSGPELQWRDGRGRVQAGPARRTVLVPREGCSGWRGLGSRRGAGQGARRPAPAHSPSHPHARTSSCCCCCCCCRRLEAAGALKARLLPTASAAPGLFPQQRW